MKGIDVSTYQGYPDWSKVRADGVEFAMVKASQGRAESSTSYLFADSKFVHNITGAPSAGVPCGVYHYLTAATAAECGREAEFFLRTIEPYREHISLYAAVDVESVYLKAVTKPDLTAIVIRFCDAVREAGFTPIVYTNPDWLQNRLTGIGDNDLWLALWRSKSNMPTGYNRMKIWQWGAEKVNGILGNVDANIGCFDLPSPEPEKPVRLPLAPQPSRRDTFAVGDEVRIENPVLYKTGKRVLLKFPTYTIMEIDGDCVTVGHFGRWVIQVHIDSIEHI